MPRRKRHGLRWILERYKPTTRNVLYMDNPIDNNKEALQKLVVQAKNGEEVAFDELHHMYVAPIYRFVYANIRNADDAEDITQSVFVKAWMALPKYKDQGKPFSSWLYRIAKNEIIDLSRKKKNVSLDDLPETSHPIGEDKEHPSFLVESKENAALIMESLVCLTSEQKEALVMKFMNDLSNKEIAAVSGKSEAGVRQMQSRALRALRQYFKDKNITI